LDDTIGWTILAFIGGEGDHCNRTYDLQATFRTNLTQKNMIESFQTVSDILLRLVAAGFIGGLIGPDFWLGLRRQVSIRGLQPRSPIWVELTADFR
jgi:hypothetical protein